MNDRRGMTVVEILMSAGLLILIAGGAHIFFQGSTRMYTSGSAMMDANSVARKALLLLLKDIRTSNSATAEKPPEVPKTRVVKKDDGDIDKFRTLELVQEIPDWTKVPPGTSHLVTVKKKIRYEVKSGDAKTGPYYLERTEGTSPGVRVAENLDALFFTRIESAPPPAASSGGAAPDPVTSAEAHAITVHLEASAKTNKADARQDEGYRVKYHTVIEMRGRSISTV